MLRLNSRTGSKTGMGLLEGLKELEGAPLPAPSTNSNSNGGNGAAASAADAMSQFSEGAKSVLGGLGGFGNTIGEGATVAGNHMRRLFGDESVDLEAPQQATLSDEVNAMCSLTWIQRIALFAMTFSCGVLMLFTSISFLPILPIAPHKFASAFTMGNVLCIVSTWLLTGPRAQLRAMFQPARALAAGCYVGSLILVLVACFFGGTFRFPLVLISLIVEIISRKLSINSTLYSRIELSNGTNTIHFSHFSWVVCIKLYSVRSNHDHANGLHGWLGVVFINQSSQVRVTGIGVGLRAHLALSMRRVYGSTQDLYANTLKIDFLDNDPPRLPQAA